MAGSGTESGLYVYDSSGLNDPGFQRFLQEIVPALRGKDIVKIQEAVRDRLGRYLHKGPPTYVALSTPEAAVIVPALSSGTPADYRLVARFTRTSTATDLPEWEIWARSNSAMVRRLGGRPLPMVFPEQR